VPIAYTPYFEHPDPTVERKQGFLTPSYISSDTIGYGLRIPYYWPIGLDKNFTLTPLITTDRGIILAGNYEQIFESGVLAVEASATYGERDLGNTVKDNEFRGHLFSYGEFVLNQNWRTNFQVELSTDDTYLRVYEFDDHTPLETRGTVREARGLASSTYTTSSAIAYWMLIRPTTPSSRAILCV